MRLGLRVETGLVPAGHRATSFGKNLRERSNATVGTPFDLLLYTRDSVEITRNRRVSVWDRDLTLIHSSWEQSIRTLNSSRQAAKTQRKASDKSR